MIDWNNNGRIEAVDVGVSIAISQEQEADETLMPQEEKFSFLDWLIRWLDGQQ